MAQTIINSLQNPEAVAEKVAADLILKINEIVAQTGNCVVAISGGSTPSLLFSRLAEDEIQEQIDWDKVYFIWVDERLVPHTDEASNYGNARKILFSKIRKATHTFPIPTNDLTVEAAAELYNREVETVLEICNKETIDIVLLGLGADGHTASLFPRSEVLEIGDRLVAPVTDGKIWDRVTLTLPALVESKNIWFMVVGDTKKAALARVLQQAKQYEEDDIEQRINKVLPAAILPLERAVFYIDENADPNL